MTHANGRERDVAGIGVAVVGCGWAGTRHVEAYAAEGATLRWVIDIEPAKAAHVAQIAGAADVGTDLERALSDPGVAAVDVCVPHYLHEEISLAAIAAGKAVLCEKPLAPRLAAADRLTDAADKAGVILMVAENECYSSLNIRIRDALASGIIGAPALVQASRECYLRESFVWERPWFLRREFSGGGILLTGGIHDFAKLRMVVGEIQRVHCVRAWQRFRELDSEDTVAMLLTFENGAVGTLVESFVMLDPTTATGAEVHRLRVDGERGSMEVLRPDRLRVSTPSGTEHLAVAAEDTFRAEIREFLACVRDQRVPQTTARSQRRNLALVEAAYASLESGNPVGLPGEERSCY